jgi:DNA-binding transcriptional MocR family regulator
MLGDLKVEEGSGTPLYRQLYDGIRDRILSGDLSDGDRLPATRELAGSLGLNRATITAAYELLEKDGLIRGHVGRGSFVKARPGARRWEPPPRFLIPSVPSSSPVHISFATSRPSELLFPLDEFREAAREVIADSRLSSILQLGSPFGFEPLRHYLLDRQGQARAAKPGDEILITNGCQQALDLLQRALVRAGDLVMIEDPVYPGLREVFQRSGARLAGIPVGDDGIDLDELRRAIRQERPKLLVVTPSFQNPTGATMPVAMRQEVLRLAFETGAVVVENDVYSDLRYAGPAVASLKQLDSGGEVVQVGSFSKVAFPGLRVGWMIGPQPIIARCAEAKQWSDLHTDHLSQAILLRFAERGSLDAHRQRVVAAGAERLAATLLACERALPLGSEFTRPRGGMNLWVRLPGGVDTADLLARATREGVGYLPGKYFAVSRPEPSSLRLSFAGLSPEQISEGILVLGGLFTSEIARRMSAPREHSMTAMV